MRHGNPGAGGSAGSGIHRTAFGAFFLAMALCLGPQGAAGQTATPTATWTPGCAYYADNFTSNTLGNYDYFMNSTGAVTTAAGAGYQITGGYLEVAPTNTENNGGEAEVLSSLFSASVSNYTIMASFNMASYATGLGIFGLVFRTGSNGSFYCFQWSGDESNACGGTPDWEIEKNSGPPANSYSYLGSCTTSPGYVLGTWVTLMVVVNGNNFLCYANFNNGDGFQLIYNATDTSSPYTTGGVGIRTYGIAEPNVVEISDFVANANSSCPSTPTPTPTATPAPTNSPTPSPTASLTSPGQAFVYPSPARGTQATLAYYMTQPGSMQMKLWDWKADFVGQVGNSTAAGPQTAVFNIAGLPSGVYFYDLVLTYGSGPPQDIGPQKFVILH